MMANVRGNERIFTAVKATYTKEIRAGKCNIDLSPEEAEAVKIAVSGK